MAIIDDLRTLYSNPNASELESISKSFENGTPLLVDSILHSCAQAAREHKSSQVFTWRFQVDADRDLAFQKLRAMGLHIITSSPSQFEVSGWAVDNIDMGKAEKDLVESILNRDRSKAVKGFGEQLRLTSDPTTSPVFRILLADVCERIQARLCQESCKGYTDLTLTDEAFMEICGPDFSPTWMITLQKGVLAYFGDEVQVTLGASGIQFRWGMKP